MPARISSTELPGARYSPPVYSGAGNARLSSLPLTVNGNASTTITADGTIYAGKRSANAARISAESAPPVTYPTRRLSPGRSSRAITTACSTPSSPANTAWTSPGSMRYPRIFTCSSARPRYRSCPSALQHTRSPVRYIRAPGPPNGHATNRDAVKPPRRQYPHPTPAPATYKSPPPPPPHPPRRHRPQPPIQHKQRRPRHRRTDRHHPRPRPQRRTQGHPHRRLGRAVFIDHHPPWRPPIHHLGRAGLTAHQQGDGFQTLGRQHPHRRGGLAQD